MKASRLRKKVPHAQPNRRVLVQRPSHADDVFPIVGIGASAGGLDACRNLLGALPAGNGMAFILVQHLDPTHESMMVELLAGETSMTVLQATEGMPVERDHLYIIPPGVYLSAGHGVLHLTQPQVRHGARLPFDFLLNSLAEEYGARTICVILSGTGADGSLGLRAVKAKGGCVIAQDPREAGYAGMPSSAIATGMVDHVLTVNRIPQALANSDAPWTRGHAEPAAAARNHLPEIIELLRTKTAHDFTLYKPGTLERRIVQRMLMATIRADDTERYLEILRTDGNELDLLAKDLLINVTSFFRDPKVFEFLAAKVVPGLVRDHPAGQPLRIWVAGCSTGEETYSLAILFLEEIAAAKSSVKLQIFASDVDVEAVEAAREGFYPDTIETDVSGPRLERFFLKDGHGYRVSSALRGAVVFTVQDVLADPPFSRIDMVSCRNLLIYLGPVAQARVASLFHFALREGGILLLGGSETIANATDRFAVVSKSERLYRRIGRSRPGEFGPSRSTGAAPLAAARQGQYLAPSRQTALAELCQRLVAQAYTPAAILINRRYECQYLMGPTDRYLQLAGGRPIHDLLAMARDGVRTKLRSALQKACQQNDRVVVTGGQVNRDGGVLAFSIAVQPVQSGGEEMLLVCFIDESEQERGLKRSVAAGDRPRVAELERELEATRTELLGAIHNLEISSEEQKAVNEEALSINEENQSTNEELLTSKEELQSLNEELVALNSQLQETLDRQRTTSNDLQNVLYSTDIATIFLDADLSIRFFTPATKSLFSVIPGDIGRPLEDINSLAADGALLTDARAVLRNLVPIEREIASRNGAWYIRRISPYRTQDNGIEGVVITFGDITERKHAADALEAAKRQAQLANVAKSRFLAAASHDLRQPLQTLSLLQEQLMKAVAGGAAEKLVHRFAQTLSSMSSMLNTLLDINQIEAGTIQAEIVNVPLNELFERLRDEFSYHALPHNIELRVVTPQLEIRTDPRLLEQMIRNLLSNALKYTERGKVLLGFRRRKGRLLIEVWDTGIGIPATEFQTIFEEYHQLDNAAPERSRGLGLGLSIVRRLANLLGLGIHVRSRPNRGSVFTIDMPFPEGGGAGPKGGVSLPVGGAAQAAVHRTGAILVIEDEPELRELLELLLRAEGHYVASASDAATALELVARGTVGPDLILADYNLPNGADGIEVSKSLHEKLARPIPVLILTGDISTEVLRNVSRHGFVRLTKPVKLAELSLAIQRLLPMSQAAGNAIVQQTPEAGADTESCVVFVVDDDVEVLAALRATLEDAGRTVETYPTAEAFLDAYRPVPRGVLLVDAYLPGISGMELMQRLKKEGRCPPSIVITGKSDVHIAVEAMKSGASDFIEKPVGRSELLASIDHALERALSATRLSAWREIAASQIAKLTSRQRQIMDLVLAGHPSKNIAADLGISRRTVENHRASIMRRTGLKSLPALARLALDAAEAQAGEPASQTSLPAKTARTMKLG
jgi:two-component system, chemotaxis family, CheB/CheR fusion protein